MTARRACPACGSRKYSPFAKKCFDRELLGDLSFASRKPPECMRLELVRCLQCDLVYAPEPLSDAELTHFYKNAAYDSKLEGDLAAQTYGKVLAPHMHALTGRNCACEVGAGNGAFLSWLVKQKFSRIIGIEPSLSAIDAADEENRPLLRKGMFDAKMLEGEKLSFLCSFMTLEHLRDPALFAEQVFDLLEPGGMLAVVVHDWKALPNRILGLRSPIIDIEHMQLFCRNAICGMLERKGFVNIKVKAFKNSYALRYWLRLLPLSPFLRSGLTSCFDILNLSEHIISLNVGNILSVGFKPF